MSNNFLFVICIKCSFDEFKILLEESDIKIFNERIEFVNFYYDKLTYFIFESKLNRIEFYEKLNKNHSLKKVINEIQFCEKEKN